MDDLWKVSACTKTFSYQNVLLTFMKWIFFPPWPSEDWTCELQILQVMLIHYVVSSIWVGGVWFQIDCRRNGWQNWRRFFLSSLLAVCEAILSWSRTQKHTSLMLEVNLGEIWGPQSWTLNIILLSLLGWLQNSSKCFGCLIYNGFVVIFSR